MEGKPGCEGQGVEAGLGRASQAKGQGPEQGDNHREGGEGDADG